MAVRMRDIATRAGVSRATVSLALSGNSNGRYKLAPETVERVKQVAEEMGYVPNRMATMLVNRKSHLIGLMQGRFDSKKNAHISSALNKVLSPEYACVMAIHEYDGGMERAHLRSFTESRLAGIVAEWSGDEESIPVYRDLLNRHQIPVVLLGGEPVEGLDTVALVSDHYGLTHKATTSLLELGHKRIAFASTGGSLSNDLLNLQGYQDAMQEAGLADHGRVYRPAHGSVTSLKPAEPEQMKEYAAKIAAGHAKSESSFTAIVTQWDGLAYELLFEFGQRGIRIPADVSVMGVGNYASSSLRCVNLSSVSSLDYSAMGRKAAHLLTEFIDGAVVTKKSIRFPVQVHLRGTTGPVPRQ